MRCKNGLVSTSANRNLGCGEWDYSCNTYLTDSSRLDSVRATHPDYIISGFSGNAFAYSETPGYAITRFRQRQSFQNTSSSQVFRLPAGNLPLPAPFSGSGGNRKIHYLWRASELQQAGLTAGDISGLDLPVLETGSELRMLRIRLKKIASDSSLTAFSDTSGFIEVFFNQLLVQDTGFHYIPFHTLYNWNGSSHLLVEISCSNGFNSSGIQLKGSSSNFPSAAFNPANDHYLETDGSSGGFSCGDINSLDSAQKFTWEAWVNIRSWQNWKGIFKDNGKTVLELGDVPGNLYCIIRNPSNTYGYATNVLPLNTWTHVAMVFDGTQASNEGRLKLFINGIQKTLSFSGTIPAYTENNSTPLMVGKGVAGRFDDVRVWSKALSADVINDWQKKNVSAGHPDFPQLQAAYCLDEGSGTALQDISSFQRNGIIEGNTAWRTFPGFTVFKNPKIASERPDIRFVKGGIIDSVSETFAQDSVADLPRIVTHYALINGLPAAVDTTVRFAASGSPVKNESGVLLETLPADTAGILNIGTLNYYSRSPQKIEIMSFVTPYGINLNLGPKGKVWEFDVSDFVHVLKGKKRLSLERGGEYQEDMDIRFVFYEGIPARKVLSLTQLWPVTQSPNSQILQNTVFEPRSLKMDSLAAGFKIRSAITGHGQEGEFIPRQHWLNLNGGSIPEFSWQVWKGCGLNPVYPQGGTWIYDRAGWCPGAPTDVREFNPAPQLMAGQFADFDYGMEPAGGDSRYIVSHQLVQYAAPSRQLDAAIEEVRNPGDRVEFSRRNPSCMNPNILITNHGSQTLTSLNIYFGLQGGSEQVYNWTGSLPFMKSTEINLPMPNLGTQPGVFQVRVSSPNGSNDEFSLNDTLRSAYGAPLTLSGGLIVDLKTNSSPGENSWELRNSNGEIMASGGNFLSNTTYRDTFNLDPGCYEFHLLDEAQDGLSWWANTAQGNGVLRFRNLAGSIIKTFNPDFGGEIFQQFVVQAPSALAAPVTPGTDDLLIYPNPAGNQIQFEVEMAVAQNCLLEIMDAGGRTVFRREVKGKESGRLDLSFLAPGLYQMKVSGEGRRVIRRFSKF